MIFCGPFSTGEEGAWESYTVMFLGYEEFGEEEVWDRQIKEYSQEVASPMKDKVDQCPLPMKTWKPRLPRTSSSTTSLSGKAR